MLLEPESERAGMGWAVWNEWNGAVSSHACGCLSLCLSLWFSCERAEDTYPGRQSSEAAQREIREKSR